MRTATAKRRSVVWSNVTTSFSSGGKRLLWSPAANRVAFPSYDALFVYVTKPTSPKLAKPMTSFSHAYHASPILNCQHTTMHSNDNEHRRSLATGRIVSFLFARWQQQFEITCFGCGVQPPNLPLPWVPLFNTMCHWTPQMYLPGGINIRRTV